MLFKEWKSKGASGIILGWRLVPSYLLLRQRETPESLSGNRPQNLRRVKKLAREAEAIVSRLVEQMNL